MKAWRARNRHYEAGRRKRLLTQGLCVYCARKRRREGKRTCTSCAARQALSIWSLKRRRQKAKRCAACGYKLRNTAYRNCSNCRVRSLKASMARWRRDREHIYDLVKKNIKAIRLEVFEAYGGARCACCGEDGYDFLTLDHRHGGGGKHRRKLGGSLMVYRWLIKKGFPQGYQVLCWNCNAAKRALGECPHARRAEGQNAEVQRLRK